jgi:hypothetical protein
MTQPASKPSFINNSARCIYFYPNGRRCRLSATTTNSHVCPAHTRMPQDQPEPDEVASTLTANLDDFPPAAQINNFPSRLLLLLTQDKISTSRAAVLAYITNQLRRAAVLAYITNQLLCTLLAIAKEENREGTTIIFDMPGPDRDHPQHVAASSSQPHQEPQQLQEIA